MSDSSTEIDKIFDVSNDNDGEGYSRDDSVEFGPYHLMSVLPIIPSRRKCGNHTSYTHF